jgi:hypothetical protein
MSTQPDPMGYSAGASLGATPTAPRKSWFSRNWKWFVPVILIVVFGLPLVVMGSVFAAMKNSDAAKESVLKAQANPRVVQKLGTPIEEGWLVSGSINTSTTSGDADLAVPISGPKGQGKVYVTAHKSAGAWNYSVMEVAFEGSKARINLLVGDAAAPSAQVTSDAAGSATTPVQPTSAFSQPATTAEPPAEATAALPAAEQAGVIQTQETNTGGVVGELTECRRHEGVLNIKIRFHNTSNKPINFRVLPRGNSDDYATFFVTAGNKKYFILKDSEGTFLAVQPVNGIIGSATPEPGQSILWWAKYPAPPADVKKINYITPVTPPFEDVPITDK